MLKVFLSSTGRDLGIFRDVTYAEICKLQGFHCVRMEDFGARDEQPLDFCLRRVAECDIFVGIVGHCFGSTPPGADERSFTEREYDAAAGKPRLMFVSPEDFLVPANLREPDETWERQQRFRSRVTTDRIVAPFTSPDNLATKVVEALANWQTSRVDSLTRGGGHPYKDWKMLGEGYSAVVFEATDHVLGRQVAIKLLRPNVLAEKPHYKDIFRREAKFLGQLDHPNIVPLY